MQVECQRISSFQTIHEMCRGRRKLGEATERFRNSAFAHEKLGDEVVDHYAHFFGLEQKAYDQAVTDWERGRYFERI